MLRLRIFSMLDDMRAICESLLGERPEDPDWLAARARMVRDFLVTEPLFPLRDAAQRLGVTPKTIRVWYTQGRVQLVRLPGGQLRIALAELERISGASEPDAVGGTPDPPGGVSPPAGERAPTGPRARLGAAGAL